MHTHMTDINEASFIIMEKELETCWPGFFVLPLVINYMNVGITFHFLSLFGLPIKDNRTKIKQASLPALYFLINKKSMEESLVFSSILKESLPRKQTVTKIVNGRLEIRLSLIGSQERTAFRSDFILKM